MCVLAEKSEIEKALPLLKKFTWEIQNDKNDKKTNFIYFATRVGQVVDLALSNDIDVGYALHRWYNYQCSKWVERIFCENGAIACEDECDHDVDLTIEGVPFDIKLSIISNLYNGNKALQNRQVKNEYMSWLQKNASQEGRKHTANKIYVVVDTLDDKCDFLRINLCFKGEIKMEQISMFGDKKQKSNDWEWSFKDYPQKNGLKVFSCFACGGGSTMGYKLAGCEVIGDLEIDPKVNKVYVENHHPKYNFLMDIRDFNKKEDLPDELYHLDILDSSPPCSTFSMSGQREEAWGKEKKFREGQKEQTLDDLLFVTIETVNKLKPNVVIMENVEGLMLGNAWKYVQNIYKKFHEIGYQVKHWLLKGEQMGVPQTRHRVFFVATKLAFNLDCLDMSFNYEPVLFGEVKDTEKIECSETVKYLLSFATPKDKSLADINLRVNGKGSRFNEMVVWDDMVCPTIHNHGHYRANDGSKFTKNDYKNCQTFPQDYDFGNQQAGYICGMSVPPVMIKRVVERLIQGRVFEYKGVLDENK